MASNLRLLLCTAACALALGWSAGCSDDDAESPGDGGLDGGGQPPDGGRAGTTGGARAGSGGTGARAGSGANAAAGSGADEDSGMSVPGTDGGTAGGGSGTGADSGTAGAAGSAGAGGTGAEPTPGCAGLMTCCAELTNPDRMSCDLVADNAEDAMCDQLRPLFCMPSTADEDACPNLSDCCEMLPRGPLRVACATTVMGNMPLECEQGLLLYCRTEGDPNACTALAECCDSLKPPQRPGCNMVAEQGIAANCELIEAALCP